MINNNVNIFIHVATLNNYMSILEDFLDRIQKSGLGAIANIHICVAGNDIELPNHPVYHNGRLEQFEFPTLNRLSVLAKKQPDSKILYIHTKGVSTPDNPCIDDWRNYMAHFVINKFQDCLSALENFDTCGVDLRDRPALHYSGNFWWANANHINSLPEFKDMPLILTERHKAEFWICSRPGKHKSLWDSGINQFGRHLHRYPPERYIK